jgi:ABC-type cobalamin/Fe3+-siderophores transport system ATPase subunit
LGGRSDDHFGARSGRIVRHYCDHVALVGAGTLHGYGPPAQIMRADILREVFATPFQERDGFILPQLEPLPR